MTVVVGLVTPHGLWMGADSAVSYEGSTTITSTPKVCRVGDILIGYAGEFGSSQRAVRWWQETPRPNVHKFAQTFKGTGCSLLVIQRGALYEIDENKGVIRARKRSGVAYGAIGSGFLPALGALYVDATNKDSVTRALKASAHHTTEVRGPFRILEL